MTYFAAFLTSGGINLFATFSSYVFTVAMFLAFLASLPQSGAVVAYFISWLILDMPVVYLWNVVVPISVCCLLIIPILSGRQMSDMSRQRVKITLHVCMLFAVGGALMQDLLGQVPEVQAISVLPAICATIFCVETCFSSWKDKAIRKRQRTDVMAQSSGRFDALVPSSITYLTRALSNFTFAK